MKTIAEQDAALPPCPKGKCQTCDGSPLKHHWMLKSGRKITLQCRHCTAKIKEFDVEDPNCPSY